MRSQAPDLSVLTDRDCLITFAAMALCCDNAVRDHEMGYHQGGGTAYITAKGVMRRTGLSRTAAEQALRRLEIAGVAGPAPDSTGWRASADTLTTPAPAGN
jgi:hypothetical protein